jgi:Fe2+ transport system protein FeoA
MSQPLWALGKGQRARIRDLSEDLPGPQVQRLKELGFLPGAMVECVHRPAFGAPRVYAVAGACFSLEQEMARRIYTEPPEESAHAS